MSRHRVHPARIWHQVHSITLALGTLAASSQMINPARADDPAPQQSNSQAHRPPNFHRIQDGNGKTIPCRCSLHGQLVPLGTQVCMQTHLGVQIARCELDLNITSWVPTGMSCEISHWQSRPSRKET